MSRITAGYILPNRRDVRRDLLWRSLAPLRWKGYPEGTSLVEVATGVTMMVDLDAAETNLLMQMDRLLGELVEANRATITGLANGEDADDHLAIAWLALWPIRSEGYGDGEYTVKIPGSGNICFLAGRDEAALLRKVDDLLDELYRENWEVVDQVLPPGTERFAYQDQVAPSKCWGSGNAGPPSIGDGRDVVLAKCTAGNVSAISRRVE